MGAKNAVALLLGHRVRQVPAIVDLDFTATAADSGIFYYQKRLQNFSSFVKPKNSNTTILVSDSQLARPEHDNVKTEPRIVETVSRIEWTKIRKQPY